MSSTHKTPDIDYTKCIGCGNCVNLCPMGAIHIINNHAYIDSKLCRNCRLCIRSCPKLAIKID
jgi:ferredoxin